MKKIMLLMLIMILGLQGCNSSSDGSDKIVKTTNPPEVHYIQPGDVADYIAKFKVYLLGLKLEFDGGESKIKYIEDNKSTDSIILLYDKGLAYMGYDFDNNRPLPSLTLLEGDTSDLANFNPTRSLVGVNMTLVGNPAISTYSGPVHDKLTGNIYPVNLYVNESLRTAGNSKLVINGTKATLSGTLGTSTYIQIQDMINTTSVDTLILSDISGSINDAINMHTGRLIRKAGLTTLIPKDGNVNSGGVDLFAAGVERVYQNGGKVGVHSWCCTADGKDAGQLSKDDKAHGAQLTYFREMLGAKKGPEFYFFTINAAPANKIHLMSVAEMVKYTLTTP
ncbi:hypothetical protein HWV01_16650 [Moritella sp. 5]|uniref:hypothetical protein n=1 Tax=Moritella sp. 5 TaxID=2746231 RepID=UPI001BA9564B|nr:hypothetical protein [Moritella sp. 5]QUM81798.1 hypothetical protein HWV01_16650 [Moritella sp. 5]